MENLYILHINKLRKLREATSHYLNVEFDFSDEVNNPMDSDEIIEIIKNSVHKFVLDDFTPKELYNDFMMGYSQKLLGSHQWLDEDVLDFIKDKEYFIYLPSNSIKIRNLDMEFIKNTILSNEKTLSNITNFKGIIFDDNIIDNATKLYPDYLKDKQKEE